MYRTFTKSSIASQSTNRDQNWQLNSCLNLLGIIEHCHNQCCYSLALLVNSCILWVFKSFWKHSLCWKWILSFILCGRDSSVHQGQAETTSTAELQSCCHLKDTGHMLNSRGIKILDNKQDWRRREIREAVWERVEDPTLNRKRGLRLSLSHTWVRALSSIPQRLSHDSELPRNHL